MADRYRPGMDAFDTPLDTRKRWRKRKSDPDAFGRFAESTARFMGSPRFILYMTVFVIVWVSANVLLVAFARKYAWDPYPFILLNLAFSTQASYSAPLILLAQNRQDDRDRVIAEQDRQNVERNLAETEYLLTRSPGCANHLARWPHETSCARSYGTFWKSWSGIVRNGSRSVMRESHSFKKNWMRSTPTGVTKGPVSRPAGVRTGHRWRVAWKHDYPR